jgi:NCS1 family nucleobase:cation symporter-1
LIGYSALLGPIAGIMIIDYFLIRRTELDVAALYRNEGVYFYKNGWNSAAVIAFVLGVLPNLPGFFHAAFPSLVPSVPEAFLTIYTYAWFVGLSVAAAVYYLMMQGSRHAK